jgi:alpha-beta hydrolase superfamily lysophospholipase
LTGHLLPRLRIAKSVDPDRLTQDPARAEQIRRDPMTHSRISIYLATQLLSQGRWALDHARSVDVPTLIMHGEDDELIDQSACEHVAIRIGERATLVRWPRMRHDLFHETERAEITERLISWLDQINTDGESAQRHDEGTCGK